jgi:hypothetical protein
MLRLRGSSPPRTSAPSARLGSHLPKNPWGRLNRFALRRAAFHSSRVRATPEGRGGDLFLRVLRALRVRSILFRIPFQRSLPEGKWHWAPAGTSFPSDQATTGRAPL